MQLNQLETGVLFRNVKPHVKSVHAYFPSTALLPDGILVMWSCMGSSLV
ncbi:hypothetical protein Pan153_22530 [Gimesia panareensis]|uniref:Uncharacterized protein n=1 Tax=Gimesia panareensis TaxID=2527978 RepID=A0A518FMQ4_9PLAN|nr:hypothetical protein [Gimesia panareensis]QDV17600.1 hypothetical protein Pan153_22530 [Gimesia panareensis]